MKYVRSIVQASGIVLLILAALVALSGRTTIFGGYHVYSVLTGSMEPTLPARSLLVVKNVDPNTLTVGDIVTFEKPGVEGVIVTHRVVAIDRADSAILGFHTKGDANPIADAWIVSPDHVRGVVQAHIPKIGAFVTFLNTRLGILLFVLLPVLLLAYEDIYTIHKTLFEWQLERKSKKKS